MIFLRWICFKGKDKVSLSPLADTEIFLFSPIVRKEQVDRCGVSTEEEFTGKWSTLTFFVGRV